MRCNNHTVHKIIAKNIFLPPKYPLANSRKNDCEIRSAAYESVLGYTVLMLKLELKKP